MSNKTGDGLEGWNIIRTFYDPKTKTEKTIYPEGYEEVEECEACDEYDKLEDNN